MTFKHVKFEDSPIMRSLEKVAREKGLVKPEPPLQKSAALAKKADLTPTANLMENIFKLCDGLREQGRVVEASEVEANYLNYKRAQTMYETHKETGDDVIHSAHPKGSHKLEGVAGDEATFEDILDKHTKILNVVEKKPTGKLSTASQILGAVKKSLGQEASQTEDPKELIPSASKDLDRVYRLAARSGGLSDTVLSWISGRMAVVKKLVGVPLERLSVDSINGGMNAIDEIKRNIQPNMLHNYLPDFVNKGVSTDVLWKAIEPILTGARQKLEAAATRAADLQANAPVDTPQADSRNPSSAPDASPGITQQFNDLINKIELYKARVESSDSPNAQAINAWLDKAEGFLKQYLDAYSKNKFKNDPAIIQNYTTKLNSVQTKVEALAQKYIK